MSRSLELHILSQVIQIQEEPWTENLLKEVNERIAASLELPEGPTPLFTTSYDAALTLLPEDFDWEVGSINGHVGGTPYARVGPEITCYANTPILSLLAACLKAKAVLMAQEIL